MSFCRFPIFRICCYRTNEFCRSYDVMYSPFRSFLPAFMRTCLHQQSAQRPHAYSTVPTGLVHNTHLVINARCQFPQYFPHITTIPFYDHVCYQIRIKIRDHILLWRKKLSVKLYRVEWTVARYYFLGANFLVFSKAYFSGRARYNGLFLVCFCSKCWFASSFYSPTFLFICHHLSTCDHVTPVNAARVQSPIEPKSSFEHLPERNRMQPTNEIITPPCSKYSDALLYRAAMLLPKKHSVIEP